MRGNGEREIEEDEALQAVRAFSLVRALAACTESTPAVQITFHHSVPAPISHYLLPSVSVIASPAADCIRFPFLASRLLHASAACMF